MKKIKIWHNPKCSKSIAAIELLEKNKCNFEVIHYLENTPSAQEIKSVLAMLGITARGLMRKEDGIYLELKLDNEALSEDELISYMTNNPKIIERPVVIKEGQAVIGRPIQKVINLIS